MRRQVAEQERDRRGAEHHRDLDGRLGRDEPQYRKRDDGDETGAEPGREEPQPAAPAVRRLRSRR